MHKRSELQLQLTLASAAESAVRRMEECRVHANRNRRNSGSVSGPQTATEPGKWILLVCISFGLLCIIQASLNVYFRLYLPPDIDKTPCDNVTAERDALEKLLQTCRQDLSKKKDELQKCHSYNYTSEVWVYFRGSVYLGSTTAQSWEQSRQFCQDRGADLPIISSVQEQTFVMNTFSERRWIGLTATRSEPREWRWVDGSQLNTSFWASGEPNNVDNEEFCAETNFRGTGNWNDEGCFEKRLCVCQKRHFKTF